MSTKWSFVKYSNPPLWSLSGYRYLVWISYGDGGGYTWSVRSREDKSAIKIGSASTLESAKDAAELNVQMVLQFPTELPWSSEG